MASKLQAARYFIGGRRVCTVADAAKKGAAETGKRLKDEAGENAKKVMDMAEQVWDSTKDATQVIKDTVAGKAEATTEATGKAVKQQAAQIQRSMNSKKTE
ncbi:hypothetical protein M569_10662 [Genlisea aurea]|uniref:Uncharacterized protein n=1 Tax=Genlisea aurea TaxID=192259 RepID=S8CHP9_9LAMI|nr:hypothetical protein M569_10662 [Genlisea aurea]